MDFSKCSLEGLVMFEFYKDKKVFVTGHTGFKGSWLCTWLLKCKANVAGFALAPDTEPSLFNILNLENKMHSFTGDITNTVELEEAMCSFAPEIVFHLAAQPLVRRSYFEPVLTYQTNVMGTLNVLEAAKKCKTVKAFVNVTTDKCYENKETHQAYKESDTLGGYDMYSSSKACVEILSSSYRRSFLQGDTDFAMATARAGNVIGGGDWAQDRIIPDCINALKNGQEIEIRNPDAVRPWQHVLEPLAGYLNLAEKLYFYGKEYASSYNFGPDKNSVLTVAELVQKVIDIWGTGSFRINKKDNLHEATLLMLDNSKARAQLQWQPVFTADEAVSKTVRWYKHFYENHNIFDFTVAQIQDYEKAVRG